MIELSSKEWLSGIYMEIWNGKPTNPAKASQFLYAGLQSKGISHPQPACDTVTMESSGLRRPQPLKDKLIFATDRYLSSFKGELGVSRGSRLLDADHFKHGQGFYF